MRVSAALLLGALLTGTASCATVLDEAVCIRPDPPEAAPLSIENFVLIEPNLAGGGQPTPEQLRQAKELGYRSIVNLRTIQEGAAAERLVVQELGMVYENVEIDGGNVTFEHADAVRRAIPQRLRPALLHDSTGNRVGAVWALLRFQAGDSVEDALAAGEAAGLRHPRLRKLVERRLRSK